MVDDDLYLRERTAIVEVHVQGRSTIANWRPFIECGFLTLALRIIDVKISRRFGTNDTVFIVVAWLLIKGIALNIFFSISV